MQGQISSLISNTTITKANGEVVQLKDDYNSTKDTVNSHTTKIGSLETNLNKVSSGQNKWLLEMFEKGEGIDAESPITIEHIIDKPLIKAVLVDDSVTNNQSHFGDNYLGRATTHVYFDMDYNWETTATSDDGSTIYVNGALVATLTSCNPTAITIPFKQGWNKITWVYNEGIGGDGWDFNPRLTTIPQVKYMNAYPMTNVDEVGNILDGNIKTVLSKQATLEQNLDGFKQTVSNTYSTKTELNNVDGKFANYSTTTDMNSAINQKANEITSTVSQTYTTKTEFDNLRVGGTNLLTKDDSNLTKWIKTGATAPITITNNKYDNEITYTNPSDGWEIIYKAISVSPNTQYTISWDWKVYNDYPFFGNYKYGLEIASAQPSNVETANVIARFDYPNTATGWSRNSITFTPTVSTIYLVFNGGYINDGTGTYKFAVNKIKLEKGNKATDWSPAPGDIDNKFADYSTTVQMNSAIEQKANEIMSSVSQTYATTQSTSTLLKESITEYYLSTSNTTLSGGAWGTTPYTPTPGKYIWQRTKSVTNAGDIKYSNPICVSDEMYTVILENEVLLLKCNSDGEVI